MNKVTYTGNEPTKEQPIVKGEARKVFKIKELPEVGELDKKINICVHNELHNQHYKEIQYKFWAAIEAIEKHYRGVNDVASKADDFAALYKELAILEKQSSDRYKKMIQDLESAVQYGRDSINEMAKQISQQNDLIVSLEAEIDQDQQIKVELRNEIMALKDECNRLQGVAEHWQMKACYNDPDKSGWRAPKIDNL